jgi:hypothetical protein
VSPAVGARRVAVVTIGAALLSATVGLDSYATGIAAQERSVFEPLLSPFRAWPVISVALLLAAWKAGDLTRRRCIGWLAAVALVTAATQLIGGYAPYAFILIVAVAIVASGFLRLRLVVLLLAASLFAWPTVAGLRNEVRLNAGAQQYVAEYDAGARLRMDRLMAPLAYLDVPVDLGQPSLAQMVRYGLVPRFLDRDRPTVASGRLINVAVGGSDTSSYSLLTIGNVWFFAGPRGLVAFQALLAVYLALLLAGRPGPFRLAVALLAVQDFALMTNTYPDTVASHIQSLVSLVGAVLVARVSLRRPGPGQRRSAPARLRANGERGMGPERPPATQPSTAA